MTTDSSDIRAKLDALGERRKAQKESDTKLAKDVEEALREAYGHVSVSEAARRLRIHRTTIYRVYHPHDDA